MQKVNEEMTINEILSIDKATAEVFMSHGLFCLGCPHAANESVKQAAMVHGIDAGSLIADLNKHFEAAGA